MGVERLKNTFFVKSSVIGDVKNYFLEIMNFVLTCVPRDKAYYHGWGHVMLILKTCNGSSYPVYECRVFEYANDCYNLFAMLAFEGHHFYELVSLYEEAQLILFQCFSALSIKDDKDIYYKTCIKIHDVIMRIKMVQD